MATTRTSAHPASGFADIHAHPMAHLAFGGHLIWGSPTGPFAQALGPCNGANHGAHSRVLLVDVAKRVLDAIVHNQRQAPEHPRDGYPSFRGWPSADTIIHQQMHVQWLRRAYDGGLRLMCAIAVNNRLLGWLMENGRECWDDDAIRTQVAAMRRIAGEPQNRNWMEIADSGQDAARIVQAGKLAIVLGAEVDQIELFLSHDPARLALLEEEATRYLRGERASAPNIEALAQAIYDAGLRQVTPVHLMDNAFGGAALHCDRAATNIHWLDLWRTGRSSSNSGWPSVVAGPRYIESRLQRVQYAIGREWSLSRPPSERSIVVYDDDLPNHVNARGLTDAGRVLLLNLWRLGVIVDVDHMSLRTKTAALAFAEQLRVPVVASHCCLSDITLDRAQIGMPERWWRAWHGKNAISQPAWPTLRHEGMRTDEDLVRIAKLGGIVAPILRQPAVRTAEGLRNVVADGAQAGGTTSAAAAAYLHVVGVLGPQACVAIGSDVNGLAQLPGPSGCRRPDGFDLYESNGLERAVTGERVWDVVADGVAHYGMLPDLIADWRAQGMCEGALAPLLHSAHGYAQAWARAEAAAKRLQRSWGASPPLAAASCA